MSHATTLLISKDRFYEMCSHRLYQASISGVLLDLKVFAIQLSSLALLSGISQLLSQILCALPSCAMQGDLLQANLIHPIAAAGGSNSWPVSSSLMSTQKTMQAA